MRKIEHNLQSCPLYFSRNLSKGTELVLQSNQSILNILMFIITYYIIPCENTLLAAKWLLKNWNYLIAMILLPNQKAICLYYL